MGSVYDDGEDLPPEKTTGYKFGQEHSINDACKLSLTKATLEKDETKRKLILEIKAQLWTKILNDSDLLKIQSLMSPPKNTKAKTARREEFVQILNDLKEKPSQPKLVEPTEQKEIFGEDAQALNFWQKCWRGNRVVQQGKFKYTLKLELGIRKDQESPQFESLYEKIIDFANGSEDQFHTKQYLYLVSICGPIDRLLANAHDILEKHSVVSYFIKNTWTLSDCKEMLSSVSFNYWCLRASRREPCLCLMHFVDREIKVERISRKGNLFVFRGMEYTSLTELLYQHQFHEESEVSLDYVEWWNTIRPFLNYETNESITELFKGSKAGSYIITRDKQGFCVIYNQSPLKRSKMAKIYVRRSSLVDQGLFTVDIEDLSSFGNYQIQTEFNSLRAALDELNKSLPDMVFLESDEPSLKRVMAGSIANRIPATNISTDYVVEGPKMTSSSSSSSLPSQSSSPMLFTTVDRLSDDDREVLIEKIQQLYHNQEKIMENVRLMNTRLNKTRNEVISLLSLYGKQQSSGGASSPAKVSVENIPKADLPNNNASTASHTSLTSSNPVTTSSNNTNINQNTNAPVSNPSTTEPDDLSHLTNRKSRVFNRQSIKAVTAEINNTNNIDNNATSNQQQNVIRVKAEWDFEASNPGELPFKAGEEVMVIDTSDEEWWYGYKSNGVEGYFPVSFVTKID
eukprot:TRINITY_DN309_c0_g1_i1.p1 TRINITY_DN309_c0_g1~~TRINITY_DN309_c0_g1_i1.p1  ORF type:complete len:684 (+),score=111.70 TRINITY_DN309_c0_g1_i1:29-2080(+)